MCVNMYVQVCVCVCVRVRAFTCIAWVSGPLLARLKSPEPAPSRVTHGEFLRDTDNEFLEGTRTIFRQGNRSEFLEDTHSLLPGAPVYLVLCNDKVGVYREREIFNLELCHNFWIFSEMIQVGKHVVIQKVGGEHLRVCKVTRKLKMLIEKLRFEIDGAIGQPFGLFEVFMETSWYSLFSRILGLKNGVISF